MATATGQVCPSKYEQYRSEEQRDNAFASLRAVPLTAALSKRRSCNNSMEETGDESEERHTNGGTVRNREDKGAINTGLPG